MIVLAARLSQSVHANSDVVREAAKFLGFEMLTEKTRVGIVDVMELLRQRALNADEPETYLGQHVEVV